jgi:hypothetical protein
VGVFDRFRGAEAPHEPGPESGAGEKADPEDADDGSAAGGRWWADEPVDDRDGDDLGRGPFADRAVELLGSIARSQKSTVVGLVGPWGSGKTSTVNLILDRLDRDRWGVAKVNPWALSGPDAIVADLLAGIRSQLPPRSAALTAFDKYGPLASPLLAAIPVVGRSASEAATAAGRLLDEGTAQDRIEKAAKALANLARPVLIVVDDVDRLQPSELLALFKAVRVLGRLPHVHYLLAYDEQTVLDVLGATDIAASSPVRALAFVEKIVTLRLDQPPVRPAQAEQLLRAGLDRALAADGVRLTEDQAQRLAEEREALLLKTFTEPRAVARLLAQVRVYLPLLGPDEVDPADFLVVTALRITQPRLYRQIVAEQAVLSGDVDGPGQEAALVAWRSADRLGQLDVRDDDCPRIDAALRRLFPLLQTEQTVLHVFDRSRRRADRRASDPDHVGRYFSLLRDPDEISDADLSDALAAWAAGEHSATADSVLQALRPEPSDSAACAAAARALRRAETRASSAAPVTAGALLPTAVSLLAPVGATVPAQNDVQTAVIAWVAQLLAKADGPGPEALLGLIARSPNQPSSLWPFLRAIGLARAERPGLDASTDTLGALAHCAADTAWDRFAAHVAEGDTAPPEQTAGLIRWLDETVGTSETDRRLTALLRDGADAADIAGRMIQTASLPGGGAETLVGFDPASTLVRLGRKTVVAAAGALRKAAGPTGAAPPDEGDVSWRNRTRLAALLLLGELTSDRAGEIRLPSPGPVEHGALRNHRPDTLRAPEEPDLRLQATFLLPMQPDLPLSAAGPQRVAAQDREQEAVRLMTESPLTTWLCTAAPLWHLHDEPWTVARTEDASVTVVAAGRALDQRGVWRLKTPIMLGAELRAGPGPDGETTLLVTVTAGLWLKELDARRKPSSTRHNTSPLPAALTVAEAYNALAALTACATTALNAHSALAPDAPAVEEMIVAVAVEAGEGPGAVVDLSASRRVPAERNRHGAAYAIRVRAGDVAPRIMSLSEVRLDLPGGGATRFDPGPAALAVAVLADWFTAAGHRGHEEELDNAWRRDLA